MSEKSLKANAGEVQIQATKAEIAPDVIFGKNVLISAEQLTIRPGVIFGNNVTIKGENIYIDSGVSIEDDVSVSTRNFVMGVHSRLESRCRILGLGSPTAERIAIGDNSLVGSDCRVFIPTLVIGDYVKVHNHTLINGNKGCFIGHNTWIGQNNILNANENLIIGNNVGLGIYTSVWTHAFYGDLLEGCNVFKVAPTVIDDDVWVMGSYNVIAPGVHIGKKTIVMTQSFVNKDIPENHCVTGNPMRDITDRITPFRTVSMEEKISMIRGYIQEFLVQRYPGKWAEITDGFNIKGKSVEFQILFLDVADVDIVGDDTNKLIFTKRNLIEQDYKFVTIFDLERREYTKRLTEFEIEVIGFLVSFRARFVPKMYPRVK